jgi:hypothetical protein
MPILPDGIAFYSKNSATSHQLFESNRILTDRTHSERKRGVGIATRISRPVLGLGAGLLDRD